MYYPLKNLSHLSTEELIKKIAEAPAKCTQLSLENCGLDKRDGNDIVKILKVISAHVKILDARGNNLLSFSAPQLELFLEHLPVGIKAIYVAENVVYDRLGTKLPVATPFTPTASGSDTPAAVSPLKAEDLLPNDPRLKQYFEHSMLRQVDPCAEAVEKTEQMKAMFYFEFFKTTHRPRKPAAASDVPKDDTNLVRMTNG